MKIHATLIIGLLMTGPLFAQKAGNGETEMKGKAESNAKAKADQLTQELGLTEVQAITAYKSFLDAELAVIPERRQCEETMQHINATLEGGYDRLIGTLTPEQAAKLDVLRNTGVEKGCCIGDARAAAGKGCCASGGMAAGQAKPAQTLSTGEEPKKTH